MKEYHHTDWIPDYLQVATQNALRVEMQKARAPSDVEGYIYTFEILGTTLSSFASSRLFHRICVNLTRAQILQTRRRYI